MHIKHEHILTKEKAVSYKRLCSCMDCFDGSISINTRILKPCILLTVLMSRPSSLVHEHLVMIMQLELVLPSLVRTGLNNFYDLKNMHFFYLQW